MVRLRPCFAKSYDVLRVDDRHALSGIIFINRNGLRWCDAPKECGPPKTISIDATYLTAHRMASRLRLKMGAWTSDWADKRWHEHEVACCY